jgi:hypothetical protein
MKRRKEQVEEKERREQDLFAGRMHIPCVSEKPTGQTVCPTRVDLGFSKRKKQGRTHLPT